VSIVWSVRAPRLAAIAAAVASLTCSQAHAQLSGASAQPQSLDGPWGLRFAPQLEEHLLRAGESAVEFGLADMAYDVSDSGIALKGHGEIRVSATVVKGDAIYYDEDTDVADAYGNVHVVRNGDVFIGPEAHLRIDASEGYMTTPKYHFNLSGGSGQAQRIDIVDNERSVVHHGTYTTCQCADDPAWYVKASRFDIDTGTNTGVARNGVIFFQGVPIFASPWMSFPLNDDRRSGLLPPTFSVSSTNGVDVELPYYFNLYDLTLTPRILSKRGEMLAENFRYLSPDFSGSLTASYLPDDEITKTNRYSISFVHNQNLGDGFAVYANYNRVSDSNVTTDLAEGSAVPLASTTAFQQEAGLTYNNGPWSAVLRDQHWQSFTTSPAYNREPEIDVKYAKYNIAGFDFGAEADATRFTIPIADSTQGSRFVFDPYVSYSIVHPDWFFTPKLQWHFATYDLSSISSTAPVGQPKTFSFNVPTLSFDSGIVMERSVNLFGTDYVQTLEPRLYYVYTPYRNQTFAPIFDTAQEDFGLAEIFTANTFVGGDRVADLNRLTSALTTRFIDPSTGEERARLTIAQEYYFTNPQVTLVPDEPETDLRGADVTVGASFKGVFAEKCDEKSPFFRFEAACK
jgi:LPS-assembly protein